MTSPVCLGIDCPQRDQCRRYLDAEVIPLKTRVIARGPIVLTPTGPTCGVYVPVEFSVATEQKA